MPKIKTHSGAKKRFSITKTGKIKRGTAKRRHDIKAASPHRRCAICARTLLLMQQ